MKTITLMNYYFIILKLMISFYIKGYANYMI